MHNQYDVIISNLKSARESNDQKKVKTWKTKLNNWQLKYGAYAPIR
jgi:hypothetical protein